jgi:hypothetical protein
MLYIFIKNKKGLILITKYIQEINKIINKLLQTDLV